MLCSTLIFSQEKNGLQFKIGTEYRITPFEIRDAVYVSQIKVNYDENAQLTGTAFNYTLQYLFAGGFGIGLSQSFQYSHIYFEKSASASGGLILNKSINGIISDFKVFVIKEFHFFNNVFYVELGKGYMNNYTNYSVSEQVGVDENGNPWYRLETRNFNYFASNVTLGVVFSRFDIGIGAHFSNGSENFATSDKFTIPYFKLNYRLSKD